MRLSSHQPCTPQSAALGLACHSVALSSASRRHSRIAALWHAVIMGQPFSEEASGALHEDHETAASPCSQRLHPQQQAA